VFKTLSISNIFKWLAPKAEKVAAPKSRGRALQRCAGARVPESTPAGVRVFQQEPEQDQEWILLIRTGARAGVIFSRVFLRFICIFEVYINCYTGVKQEQESINFV